jgi:ribokinase
MEKRPRVTVLGSLNMDISVNVSRLPGPGATVLGDMARFTPGGKGANQAVAAARLGGDVRMVGCTGADDFGRQLTSALEAEGIDTAHVTAINGVPTGLAMITVDAVGENIITVAPGANHQVDEALVGAALDSGYDALVISAEIPVPAIRSALAHARARSASGFAGAGPAGRAANGAICLLNLAPAPVDAAAIVADGVDWLIVNESEAAVILGGPVDGLENARRAALALTAAGARNAVVTVGPHGVAVAGAALSAIPAPAGGPGQPAGSAPAGGPGQPGGPDQAGGPAVGGAVTIPGFAVTAVDSVGAGDTFVGALAVALAAGIPVPAAVRAASAAAAAAVTRRGAQAAMPRPADVASATAFRWPLPTART